MSDSLDASFTTGNGNDTSQYQYFNGTKVIRVAANNGSVLTRPCAFDWPPAPDPTVSCPNPGIVPELTRIILSILLPPNVSIRFVPAGGYGFDLDKLSSTVKTGTRQTMNNKTMTEADKKTILGLIETGEVDLTAGDLTLTSERAEHFAHLSAILPYRMAFILRKEEVQEPSLNFQNLFKWEVYLLLGSFIVCYQIYRHIIQRLSVGSTCKTEWSQKLLIRQAVFLGIFAAVLFRLCSAEIVLIFNKPIYNSPISTTMQILEAMESGDLTGVTGYKIYWDQVLNPVAYRHLSPIFKRFMVVHDSGPNPPQFARNESAAVERISRGTTAADRRLVVLTEEIAAEIFLSSYCNLRIVVDDFFSNKFYTMYAKPATLRSTHWGSLFNNDNQGFGPPTISNGLVTLIKADFQKAKRKYVAAGANDNNENAAVAGCNDPLISTPVQESVSAFEAILPHPLKFDQLKLIFQIFMGFNVVAAAFFGLELGSRLCKWVKCCCFSKKA